MKWGEGREKQVGEGRERGRENKGGGLNKQQTMQNKGGLQTTTTPRQCRPSNLRYYVTPPKLHNTQDTSQNANRQGSSGSTNTNRAALTAQVRSGGLQTVTNTHRHAHLHPHPRSCGTRQNTPNSITNFTPYPQGTACLSHPSSPSPSCPEHEQKSPPPQPSFLGRYESRTRLKKIAVVFMGRKPVPSMLIVHW